MRREEFLEAWRGFDQSSDKVRIELSRGLRGQHPDHPGVRQCRAIWPSLPESIVDGCEPNHASGQRDLIPAHSFGISIAIPSFVMRPNHIYRHS